LMVVDEKMSESLAYEITRVLFDHLDELVAIHDVAKELTLRTAPVGSPVPFHPGSVRYYREKGVWKEEGSAVIPPKAGSPIGMNMGSGFRRNDNSSVIAAQAATQVGRTQMGSGFCRNDNR